MVKFIWNFKQYSILWIEPLLFNVLKQISEFSTKLKGDDDIVTMLLEIVETWSPVFVQKTHFSKPQKIYILMSFSYYLCCISRLYTFLD